MKKEKRVCARPAVARLAYIEEEIREKRLPNVPTLAEALETSPRTIERDLEFLRDRLGAPIVYDRKLGGYVYSDPAYTLPPITLTEGELFLLFMSERVLESCAGNAFEGHLRRTFKKLASYLPESVSIDLPLLAGAMSFRSSGAASVDPGGFETIYKAIQARRRLRIRYHTASRDAKTTRMVDPYHLACRMGGWYLIGYDHLRGEVLIFAMARVLEVEATETEFEIPADFSIESYFGGVFGVMRGEEPMNVELWFEPATARWVRERNWHETQSITDHPDGSITMSLRASGLEEIRSWILSFGGKVRVKKPRKLALAVVEEAKKIVEAEKKT